MHCSSGSTACIIYNEALTGRYYMSRYLRVEHCPWAPIHGINLYESIPELRGKKLPEFLTAMDIVLVELNNDVSSYLLDYQLA